MKTARENVSISTSRAALKRLLDEYESFDEASKLCADYCITADEIDLLVNKISKPKRSKSRLMIAVPSDRAIDIVDPYLVTR